MTPGDIEALVAEAKAKREAEWKARRDRQAIERAQHRRARTYGVPVRLARRALQVRRTR